jgi:hypothetical protein
VGGAAPFGAALSVSSMGEKCEQDDNRDRDAKQPEKNASTHDLCSL